MATLHNKGPLFLIFFLAFSFGTGIILVTASQQNTEGRSKASGLDPYAQPTLAPGSPCVIATDSNPNSCNHCQYGTAGNEAAQEGQTRVCGTIPVGKPGSMCAYDDSKESAVVYCKYCKYGSESEPGNIDFGMCSQGNVIQRIGDAIQQVLEKNGIGVGKDLVCPEGQTLNQSPGGTTWCVDE